MKKLKKRNKERREKMAESMAYIGKKSCGCIVAACVDNPEHKREIARNLAEWIRDGLTIERVTCDFVRNCKFGCDCNKTNQKQQVMDFA
jgi:hypothetical protein